MTDWNISSFIKRLLSLNPYAQKHKFCFCNVSGLQGFEEALEQMQTSVAFVCVSNLSDGYIELDNSPHNKKVKTIFIAMRHPLGNMEARQKCMDVMQELFRQFMSVLILEKTRLQENHIYLDSRIKFTEIDRYFFSGCACAYFQIGYDLYTDFIFNPAEWDSDPTIIEDGKEEN